MAREAAPVEELALSADALQHVDPLTAEVTLLAVCHCRAGTVFWLWRSCWFRTEIRGHRLHHLRGKRSFQGSECACKSALCLKQLWMAKFSEATLATHKVILSHPELDGSFLSCQLFL